MPTKQFMKECPNCKKSTKHLQQVDSSVPHILLTIITIGLWIPIWILRAMATGMRSPAECTICGKNWQKNLSNKSAPSKSIGAPETTPLAPVASVEPKLASVEPRAAQSPSDANFETKWEMLVKYDPDVQSALSELSQFGKPAIDELKSAYQAVDDPTKIGFIVQTIKEQFSKQADAGQTNR